jgi:hypothetical protein
VTGSPAAGFTTTAQIPNVWFRQTWAVGNTLYGITAFVSSAIMQSTDGVTWTTVGQLPPSLSPMYYFDDGATKYVVGENGKLSSSTDNVTWSSVVVIDPEQRTIWKLVRLGDHLIAVGDRGLLLASLDGTTWTPIAPDVGSDPLTDIAITDRGVVLVGALDVLVTAP